MKDVKKTKQSYQDSVKEAIMIALVQLMKEKELSQITIQELIKRAGVGRSSFYRHFYSKEDALLAYAEALLEQTNVEIDPNEEPLLRDHMIACFRIYKENKDFFLALKQNHMLHLLYRCTTANVAQNIAGLDLYRNPYQAVFFASASIGVTIQWIETGFRENEEELAEMFLYLMDGHHREA